MRTLLLQAVLLALSGHYATGLACAQTAPAGTVAPSCGVQAAKAATPAGQTPAPSEADSLNTKVVQLFREEKFDEASAAAERVLEIMEGAFGASHRCVADALANLAEVRLAKKEYDKTETLYRRALAIYEAGGDGNDAPIVSALERLVFLSAFKRDFDKAEESAQRLAAFGEKRYKPQQLEMARALIPLAEVARLKLDNKRARSVYERVVGIMEQYAPAALPREVRISLANYLGLLYAEERGNDSELTERINKLLVAISSGASSGGKEVVEGGIINGRAVYKPQPEYPFAAKMSRAQGIVKVRVTVDETGKVIAAKVFDTSPHPSLSRASEAAARGARFTPTLLSGTPVKVNGIITYRFVLQ